MAAGGEPGLGPGRLSESRIGGPGPLRAGGDSERPAGAGSESVRLRAGGVGVKAALMLSRPCFRSASASAPGTDSRTAVSCEDHKRCADSGSDTKCIIGAKCDSASAAKCIEGAASGFACEPHERCADSGSAGNNLLSE